MKRLWLVALTTCVLWAWAGVAWAYTSDQVILGFGDTYVRADGSTATHRGIDLVMGGSGVVAPLAGTVTFAGRVPATSGGGTVGAVSIDTGSGLVTLLPLDTVRVDVGQRLDSGSPVGSLADAGDASHPDPHLHMGLRKGGVYLDPAALLQLASTAEAPAEQVPATDAVDTRSTQAPSVAPAAGVTAGVGSEVRGTATGSIAPGAELAPGVSVPGAAGDAVATARAATSSPASLAKGPVVGVSVAPPVETQGALKTDIAPVPERTSALASLMETAADGMLAAVRWLGRAGASGAVALVVAALAGGLLLSRRAYERRFTSDAPVSHRWATLLQQLRAGDTLRGLTSCSGHAAFTVPGPSSPEEVTK